MKYTQNLNLIKPDGLDNVLISDINENMDTLDNALKGLQESKATNAELKLLEQSVTEHSTQMATTAKAGHVMLVNNFTTGGADKAASAETVKLLKQETDKKVEINKFQPSRIMNNYASQIFTKAMYVDFNNNITSEVAEISIPPSVAFSGSIELNLTSSFFNSDATGTAKIMIHLTLSGNGVISTQIVDIITMTPQFAQNFYVGKVTWVAGSNTYVLNIYKRQFKNPLQIEATFRCSGGSFSQASVDAIKTSVWDVGSVISTTDYPIQQSIFTSVSNGKATVNQAVTDMGIYTAPDAPFATTATNIRNLSNIKAGTGTITNNGSQTFFNVTGLSFKPKAYMFRTKGGNIPGSWGVHNSTFSASEFVIVINHSSYGNVSSVFDGGFTVAAAYPNGTGQFDWWAIK